MTWLLSLIAKIAAAVFSEWQADKNAKDLGRAQGASETDKVLKEIADAQARNNAEFRDLTSVIERLRRDAGTKPGPSTGDE